MDVIRLLPDSVANQIAAGEVIQRPASVVKELVENAVDAGATEISVIIKDAGRTLIQVIDNGSGMSATDARLAFERHSTSKIKAADDLFALHTMGFRGEALASICAVSQVELLTMRRSDTVGTRLIISGSHVESQEPEACAPGSSMMVRNLFFNIPARRKFLKKDAVEMSNILREFERLALVNPSLRLTLTHNGLTVHDLPPANLRRRIVDLFGQQLDSRLIPVETDTAMVRIEGFVIKPEHCRKRGALQYLFVNGRNMRHPLFHKTILRCYEDIAPTDEQPSFFINFTVDPADIDVNIHPTKNEIKFEHEQDIRRILFAAVRETIARFNALPAIDFDTLADSARPDIPAPAPGGRADAPCPSPRPAATETYNPFASASSPASPPRTSVTNWEELYRDFMDRRDEAISMADGAETDSPLDAAATAAAPIPAEGAPIVGIGHRYAAVSHPRGLCIIDLHRAHETVLHARFSAALSRADALTSQRLIFAETLQVDDPARRQLLAELEPRLATLGFDIAHLGGGTWAINALPSIVDSANPAGLLEAILDETASANPAAPAIVDNIAAAMARAAAFRSDRALSPRELQHLVAELMALTAPGFSPAGLPVFTVLTEPEINKML